MCCQINIVIHDLNMKNKYFPVCEIPCYKEFQKANKQ